MTPQNVWVEVQEPSETMTSRVGISASKESAATTAAARASGTRPAPTIAVIMPAYNEASRIAQSIASLARYRATGATIGPIVIADDGSEDATAAVASAAAEQLDLSIEIIRMPHRGKAATVRAAMLEVGPRAGTQYLMMLDADDELGIDQLDRIDWSSDASTIYIGRRVGAIGSESGVSPSPTRRAMSLAMRTAARVLLGIGYPDTQCGFKLFPTAVAIGLFEQQRSTNWTFDAEILFIADRVSHLPVREVPVIWRPRGTSHVNRLAAVTSAFAMFATALRRVGGLYEPVTTRSASLGLTTVVE